MAWHGAAPRMAVRAANARRADSRAPDRAAIALLRRSPSPEGLALNPEAVRSPGTPAAKGRNQAHGTDIRPAAAGPPRRPGGTFHTVALGLPPCPHTSKP